MASYTNFFTDSTIQITVHTFADQPEKNSTQLAQFGRTRLLLTNPAFEAWRELQHDTTQAGFDFMQAINVLVLLFGTGEYKLPFHIGDDINEGVEELNAVLRDMSSTNITSILSRLEGALITCDTALTSLDDYLTDSFREY